MASLMTPGTYGFLAGVYGRIGVVLVHQHTAGHITSKEIADSLEIPQEYLPLITTTAALLGSVAVFAACERALRALRPGTSITLVHTSRDLATAFTAPAVITHPILQAPLARITALIAEASLTVTHRCSDDTPDHPVLDEALARAEQLAMSAPLPQQNAPIVTPILLGSATVFRTTPPVDVPSAAAAVLTAALQQDNLTGAMHPARFADTVSTCWLTALTQQSPALSEDLCAQLLTLARQAAAAGRTLEYLPGTNQVQISRKEVKGACVRWPQQLLAMFPGITTDISSDRLLALCKAQERILPTLAGKLIDLTLSAKWTLEHGLNVSWA